MITEAVKTIFKLQGGSAPDPFQREIILYSSGGIIRKMTMAAGRRMSAGDQHEQCYLSQVAICYSTIPKGSVR